MIKRVKCGVCDNWQALAVWKLHGKCIKCGAKPGQKWDDEE